MRPTFDEKDQARKEACMRSRKALNLNRVEPLVGDYVKMPGEEGFRRLTLLTETSVQTTMKAGTIGARDVSFFLFNDGTASFSGSLDYLLPRSKLVNTKMEYPAAFWFFHHSRVEPGNAVYFTMHVTVWDFIP